MISLAEAVSIAWDNIDDIDKWDSLIIDRRKPHTYRAFMYVGDDRICLHRFGACDGSDVFRHPHPWPCRIHVLGGVYNMWIGSSPSLEGKPQDVAEMVLSKGSSYEMLGPNTWHSVHPVTDCFSIMVNGKRWGDDEKHGRAPTTVGKDLNKFTREGLEGHLAQMKEYLYEFGKDNDVFSKKLK